VTGPGFAVFATALGPGAIAWNERGVVGVQLPEESEAAARARMQRRFAGARELAAPPEIARAIDAVAALLGGEAADLSFVVLDEQRVPPFDRGVYAAARAIPPGATRTYGEIARQLGDPGAARAVGRALARNPFPIVVPCHRVLAAGAGLGGFSAPGGTKTKVRLLEIEGAETGRTPSLFEQD
jgi:methylated-DNA-[protein]-cysteine S-methyltransferase